MWPRIDYFSLSERCDPINAAWCSNPTTDFQRISPLPPLHTYDFAANVGPNIAEFCLATFSPSFLPLVVVWNAILFGVPSVLLAWGHLCTSPPLFIQARCQQPPQTPTRFKTSPPRLGDANWGLQIHLHLLVSTLQLQSRPEADHKGMSYFLKSGCSGLQHFSD